MQTIIDLEAAGEKWYALQVKAGHERITASMIRYKGFEDFCHFTWFEVDGRIA